MARPVHFEIHAADPDRATAFYAKVFGWDISPFGPMGYREILTGPADAPGLNGGMLPRGGDGTNPAPGGQPNAFIVTIGVDDLDATLATALDAGGGVALPKNPIPGIGWLAYLFDTEGNILGILQEDPTAPAPDFGDRAD